MSTPLYRIVLLFLLAAVHQHPVTSFAPAQTTTAGAPLLYQKCHQPKMKKKSVQLNAASSLVSAVASSPLGSIAILAGIVLVHESGHYLAARLFKVQVEEFSIGIGPKLFGFKAFGDEFNLRALPLGGEVRLSSEIHGATYASEHMCLTLYISRFFLYL
jgi:hypothetical protein